MTRLATHKLLLPLILGMVHLLSLVPCMHTYTASDLHALVCLKSQLSDPSGALVSWNSNASLTFCDWHGVTCSRRHKSRVVSLDLESLNLTGQMFPCISELSFLSRIHMPNNQLNGHISHDIGRLTRLWYLNLSMNSLTGTIPDTISSCSRLKIISLKSNSLEGEITNNLAQCSFLQQIVLSNNKLQGGIPPALFNNTTISYIDLSRNGLSGHIPSFCATSSPLQYLGLTENFLSGAIPASIGNISSLTSLKLDYNSFQGSIPESLCKISSLQVLNLKRNNLSGVVPPAIYKNCSSLTYLSLSLNKLVGTIPADIGYTLPNLAELIIGVNQFHGSIPASLTNASNLQNLDVRQNSLTGVIPPLGLLSQLTILDLGTNMLQPGDWTFLSSLTNCTQLKMLFLDFNSLGGTLPSTITNLSNNLQILVLSENQLTGYIPSQIDKLTSLNVLVMQNNSLSGHIPDTLGNLANLSILRLFQNKLSGEIPQSIGKMEWLTELYLMENSLTGRIPASLVGCKNLVLLNLSFNSFYGSIPWEIFSISTLSKGLDLSYNQLTGNIPLQIGSLINLNSLSISNNQLSGEIPSTLGECLVLESLNLEANSLKGEIPRSLSTLKGINEMDLSRNNISGKIPEFLESFSSLYILNLSFNDFEGLVPKGGVFANSSAVFLQGNKKLCARSPMQQVPLCKALASNTKKISYILTIVVPLTITVVLTSACLAIILRKKKGETKQPIVQSFKGLNRFSYNDLFEATNGFSSASIVGSGRFGLVYKGQFEFETVAIKVFKLDQFGASKNFLAECEALRNIRHRNLIRVISVCSTIDPKGNEFKALVLEYKEHGNLGSRLHPNEYKEIPLSLGSRLKIAVDIAAALDYLHTGCSPPLVHCDLKPSNVLLDDEMAAYLCDFGLTKFLHNDSSTGICMSSSIAAPRGSVGYIAPEYGTGCKISTHGDVYSYGIILLEMITGKLPTDDMFTDGMNLHSFVESALPQKFVDILEPSLSIYDKEHGENLAMVQIKCCVKQLAELGLKCSEKLPKDRPTMEDVYAEVIGIQETFSSLHCCSSPTATWDKSGILMC